MKTLTIALITFFLSMLAWPALGAACHPASQQERPKIGLALGGGGARGAAHIGVLKQLEELQVPVDYIAGTSMGAVVGSLYASGLDADEIETFIAETSWDRLFSDATRRQDRPLRRKADDSLGLFGPRIGVGEDGTTLTSGAIAGQKIRLLLENRLGAQTHIREFGDLPIPFRAVATDLVSGEVVVLQSGSLARAVRASMSVPGAFDPMRDGGRVLVDGGLVRNLPVDIVRDMGAEVVIAVNVEYPLLDAEALHGVVEVVSQLTTLMVESNTRRQIENLDEHDVLITPELDSEFGSAEFQRSPEAVELGYEAARRAQSELRVLQLDEGAYAAWRAGVDACVGAPPRVEFVQIENGSRFSDAVIGNLVSGADGRLLDAALRDREMSHIHALGFIRSATWEVIEQDGRTGLLVQVEPDQRGTDFIESGLELTGGPRGSNVNLKAGYLKTDLDERGSELRGIVQVGNEQGLLAEYYKPLDDGLRWILHPQLTVTRRNFTSFDPGGAALAEWEVDEYGAELRIGREFSRHAGLFLTASRYAGNARIKTGPPESDNLRFNGGEWSLEAVYDRLDNRFLPSSGTFGRLAYVVSDRQLGADADFEQFELNLFSSLTRGRHTAWLGTRFNTTLDDDAPVYALYSGGGFLNMSGFEPDQLIGQHFGQTMLGYRFRLDQSGLLPAYAGMTLEYGGAAARREDVYADGLLNGSLYLGYDSPLGPLYLGLGWSEEQSGLFFVRLGTLFGTEAIGRR